MDSDCNIHDPCNTDSILKLAGRCFLILYASYLPRSVTDTAGSSKNLCQIGGTAHS